MRVEAGSEFYHRSSGAEGDPLFTVHANDGARLAEARERLLAAHTFSDSPVQRLPLFYRRVADEEG